MKTVLQNKYIEYLKTIQNVSNVELFEVNSIKFRYKINEEFYDFIFTGLDEYELPSVMLCNPKEGISKKPHLLQLKKNELFYLCLSIKEDISIRNKDYKDILNYTLTRIVKLITMTQDEEKREFRKEFIYFWNKSAINKDKIQLYISSSSKVKILDSYNKKNIDMFVDKNISINELFLNQYKKKKNSIIYIPLVNSNGIMPPINDNRWNIKEINGILENCINEENIEILENINIDEKDIFIIFEMYIPGVVPISFALKLKFRTNKNGNLFKSLENVVSIECLKSERCDMEYLFRRIGVKNRIKNKKIFVVGAGSLGSYVISELPKIGIKNMTIVDSDKMLMENIMRHSLGAKDVNYSKVISMKFELELKYPEVKINIKNEQFDIDSISKYNLEDYDLIIIATGGTDYMLKLNKYFKAKKMDTPVLFTWIEARGIGVHALVVDYNRKGCFNCLYDNSKTNKAHFSQKNYKDELTGTGCGGVINQYGNIVLLKGSAMILNIVLDILKSNRINDNLLFSVKTSNEYVSNNGYISLGGDVVARTSYISEGCGICGSEI